MQTCATCAIFSECEFSTGKHDWCEEFDSIGVEDDSQAERMLTAEDSDYSVVGVYPTKPAAINSEEWQSRDDIVCVPATKSRSPHLPWALLSFPD